jgi:ribosomal protein S18 acetylase RimI-like enzyme
VAGERVGWVQSSVHGNAIHLAQLHIAPAWRGRGIGRAVVDRVIERAHAARRDVTLAVQAASPARRLYERLGFERDITSVPAGDTIYLRRQLTSE